jgi:hypothetical protein
MNCGERGPQTDVSAPGAGAAAAEHHRDMMWLLWALATPGCATTAAPRPLARRIGICQQRQ